MQCEGTADIPTGADRDRCLQAYFAQYPDGVERALDHDIVHVARAEAGRGTAITGPGPSLSRRRARIDSEAISPHNVPQAVPPPDTERSDPRPDARLTTKCGQSYAPIRDAFARVTWPSWAARQSGRLRAPS